MAESLDALARALRDWPADAWRGVAQPAPGAGLFERLAARIAPAAADAAQRTRALQSAQAVADVLRVLWPEATVKPEQRELALASY